MASPFDDDHAGDDSPGEPVCPQPDRVVSFGADKIKASERKAAIPEFIHNLIGAADSIARRAQHGPISREEAYLLKAIINAPFMNNQETTASLVRKLGLKFVEKTRGKTQGLFREDPLKACKGLVKPQQ